MLNASLGLIYRGRLILKSNLGHSIGSNLVLVLEVGGRSGRRVPESIGSGITSCSSLIAKLGYSFYN